MIHNDGTRNDTRDENVAKFLRDFKNEMIPDMKRSGGERREGRRDETNRLGDIRFDLNQRMRDETTRIRSARFDLNPIASLRFERTSAAFKSDPIHSLPILLDRDSRSLGLSSKGRSEGSNDVGS